MLHAFTLDRRSLALLRIAFGLILLIDLGIHLPDVLVFYTDRGVFPTDYLIPDRFPGSLWSFLWFNDEPSWVYLHIAIQFVLALLLVIGYKTKWVLFLSWLFLLSLDNRNPVILHGGDKTLRIMMFWSLFLPLGDRWSIDSFKIKPEDVARSDNYLSVSSFAYILQLCQIYWFAGLFKLNPLWLEEKQGVIMAFKGTFFNTPLAEYLLNFSDYLQYFDIVTIGLELGLPFLVFIPKYRTRLIAVTLFLLLHLSFGLVLSLGMFPFMSMATWLALLPRKDTFESLSIEKEPIIDVVITIMLSLVVFVNIATLEIPGYKHGLNLNYSVNKLLNTIHLDQKWYMFSRVFPYGKLTISAQKNGTQKVIFNQSHYPSHRWRTFYYYLFATANEVSHKEGQLFSDYYCSKENLDEITIDFLRLDPIKPGDKVSHKYLCKQQVE